jgi:hypothetical protein
MLTTNVHLRSAALELKPKKLLVLILRRVNTTCSNTFVGGLCVVGIE